MGCINSKTTSMPQAKPQQEILPKQSEPPPPAKPLQEKPKQNEPQPEDVQRAFFQAMFQAQMVGAMPMSLQFDKTEFSRKVDEEYIANVEISPEQQKEVEDAIKESKTMPRSGSMQQVAAQFKNTCIKSSAMSPQLIEAILTRIVKERKFEAPGWPPVEISYTDNNFLYGQGVRTFTFLGKQK